MPTLAHASPFRVDPSLARSKIGAMNDKQLAEFAIALRERREKLQLTRSKLAERAGITRTTLRMLEKGVQHPEPGTLEQLAKALETTEFALTGHKAIEADNPLLRDLVDEDLDVAQAFHHAPTRVRLRALGVLQERGRKESESTSMPVSEWARRLLELDPEQRQLVAHMIAELKSHQSHRDDGQSSAAALAESFNASELAARRLEQDQKDHARADGQTKKPSIKRRRGK